MMELLLRLWSPASPSPLWTALVPVLAGPRASLTVVRVAPGNPHSRRGVLAHCLRIACGVRAPNLTGRNPGGGPSALLRGLGCVAFAVFHTPVPLRSGPKMPGLGSAFLRRGVVFRGPSLWRNGRLRGRGWWRWVLGFVEEGVDFPFVSLVEGGGVVPSMVSPSSGRPKSSHRCWQGSAEGVGVDRAIPLRGGRRLCS